MEKFIELCEQFSFTQFVTLIVLLTLGIKGAADVIKGVKTYVNDWYNRKRGIEKKDETIEQRVNKLEESDKFQIERLDSISAGVQQIAASVDLLSENTKKQLDDIESNSKRRTIITTRSQLYRLHNEFMKKGSVTMAEREMFDDLGLEYLNCGGNSIFKDRIIPEVQSLSIRDV